MDDNNKSSLFRAVVVDGNMLENTEDPVRITAQVSEIRIPENVPVRVIHTFPKKHVYEEVEVESISLNETDSGVILHEEQITVSHTTDQLDNASGTNTINSSLSQVDLQKLDDLINYKPKPQTTKHSSLERTLFFILVFFVMFDVILFLSYILITSNTLAFGP